MHCWYSVMSRPSLAQHIRCELSWLDCAVLSLELTAPLETCLLNNLINSNLIKKISIFLIKTTQGYWCDHSHCWEHIHKKKGKTHYSALNSWFSERYHSIEKSGKSGFKWEIPHQHPFESQATMTFCFFILLFFLDYVELQWNLQPAPNTRMTTEHKII